MREFFKDLGAGFVAAAMALYEVAVVVVMVLSFAVFAAMCFGCGSERGPCDTLALSQIPDGHFTISTRVYMTLEGFRVDLSGHEELWPGIGERIDSEIRGLYQCLEDEGLLGRELAVKELRPATCYGDHIVREKLSCRDCIVIKIPQKWESSCVDAGIQLLPISAPDWHCIQKGLTPTDDCPCRWRAGIQDDHNIVTTPDLGMFRHELMRYISSCQLPSASPALRRCL